MEVGGWGRGCHLMLITLSAAAVASGHSCAEIGPASVMVGNLVSGKRIAQASGRDLGQTDDNDQVGVIKPSV